MSVADGSDPFVSIILPTYNRAYCLDRAINSVRLQTYGNWELIVIDNHSTDSTDQLLAGYRDPRIFVLKIQNHGVIAKSRNKGLVAARGIYVAFLDSDDWWSTNKLKLAVEALGNGADLIYSDAYLVQKNLRRWVRPRKIRCRQLRSPVFHDLLLGGNSIVCSSVVTRKELFDRIEGFSEDEQLIAAEDFDAWLRLARQTESFIRLKSCLVYCSRGQDNSSTSERAISNCKRLVQLYASEWGKKDKSVPIWITYSLSVALYRTLHHREAYKQAKTLLSSIRTIHAVKPMLIIKSVYILMNTWFKR